MLRYPQSCKVRVNVKLRDFIIFQNQLSWTVHAYFVIANKHLKNSINYKFQNRSFCRNFPQIMSFNKIRFQNIKKLLPRILDLKFALFISIPISLRLFVLDYTFILQKRKCVYKSVYSFVNRYNVFYSSRMLLISLGTKKKASV
jgi:hypothetical protein